MKISALNSYKSCWTAAIAGFLTVSAVSTQGTIIMYSFTGNTFDPTEDSVGDYSGGPMTFDSDLFGTTGFLTTTPSDGAFGYGGSGGPHWAADNMNQSTVVDLSTPYLQFTMSPEPGMSVEVQRITFGARTLGTTVTGQKDSWPGPVQYEIRSSDDGYASAVAQGVFPNQAGGNTTWYVYDHIFSPVTGAPDDSLAFRIYLLDAGPGTRVGSFRIDDVAFSPIPEASNIALLLSAAALLFVFVKRRRPKLNR